MQPQDFRPDDLFARIEGLVETVDAERRLRERAEAADRAKSDLLAVVSHELRTPMGAVISMSELLLNGPLDPTQRHYAETLQQSAKSLLTVLNDILDYSKLEAGRFELDRAVFDLHELVRSVGSELQARTREKGIEGVVNIGPSCPRFVVGDASRVRQVLTNLIDNAVKYSRTRDPATIEIGLAGDEDGRAVLFVRDNGVGFDMQYVDKLFGVFQRLHRAEEFEGTGIGLATVRRIVARHGGRVWAEGVLNEGATIYFTLERALLA